MMLWLYLAVSLIGASAVLFTKSQRAMGVFTAIATATMLGVSAYMFSMPSAIDYFSINMFSAISALMVSVIFTLSAIYLIGYLKSLSEEKIISKYNLKFFNISFIALHLVVILSIFSDNIALFWIFVELSTLFSAILLVLVNAKENITAGLKYIFITSSAMLFSFIGIIMLYGLSIKAGEATLNLSEIIRIAPNMDPKIFLIAYIFMFIGFAAKSGIVPFHSWMPHTYSKAPSAVSTVLAACVSYLGIYAILKITGIAFRTGAFVYISKILLAFGILTLAIASITLLAKRNIKKMIGYSSIEGYGFILLAAALWNETTLYWAIIFIFAASIAKTVLFFSAGIIHIQYSSIHLHDIKNVARLQKLSTLGLVIGSLASIGVPLLPLFFPKIVILGEIAKSSIPILISVLFFFMIAASAFGIILVKLFSQSTNEKIMQYKAPFSMKISLVAAIILLILLGMQTEFATHIIESSVQVII